MKGALATFLRVNVVAGAGGGVDDSGGGCDWISSTAGAYRPAACADCGIGASYCAVPCSFCLRWFEWAAGWGSAPLR